MRFLLRSSIPVLLALATLGAPPASFAQVSVGLSITIAPPALPVYAQPVIPGSGYLWAPGYWAWAPEGYYWVPGTWVQPPAVGLLWTPGYWAWNGRAYVWNIGYWGPQVGYYGGINYGFGYGGVGYAGGYWRNNAFYYNRATNNLRGVRVAHSYSKPIASSARASHVSFNGGKGGTTARPAARQGVAAREPPHTPPTPLQTQHEQAARTNPALRAATNHGRPGIAATQKPGVLEGPGIVPARTPKTTGNARPPARTAGPAAAPVEARPPSAPDNTRRPERNAGPAVAPKPEPQKPAAKASHAEPRGEEDHHD